MRFLPVLAVVILIGSGHWARSQDNPVDTERIGQAFSALAAGENAIQFQPGLLLVGSEGGGEFFSFNGTFRVGIPGVNNLEARLGYDFGSFSQFSGSYTAYNLGAKYTLKREGDSHYALQLDYFGGDGSALNLLFIGEWALSDKCGVYTTTGFDLDNDRFIYVFGYGRALSETLAWIIELYGDRSGGDTDISFDTGFNYFINSQIVLDANAGYGDNDNIWSYYATVGLSWKFNYR